MPERPDALAILAPMLRVRPELQDYCRFGGHWRSAHRPEDKGWSAFHMVVRGACSVERSGQAAIRMEAGDVLLLPHGDAHVVYSGDRRGAFRDIAVTYRDHIHMKETDGTTIDTELICGRLILQSATEHLLLNTLPHVILLRSDALGACGDLIGLIRDELRQGRAAAAAVAGDLASALLVMLLRAHFDATPPADGLLALMGRRETARAAAAMLKDPARDWPLDELASIAAVSRATLVRAFHRACGVPPQAFLTEVRMGLARNRIAQTDDPLAEIASDVGYQSEAALSRAFLRRFAIRPGGLRRNARAKGNRADMAFRD